MGFIIHITVEHDLANVIQLNHPQKVAFLIHYREDVSVGMGHGLHQIAQRLIGPYFFKVFFDLPF